MIVDEWVTGTIEKMRSVSEPELLTSKTASVVQQPNNKKVQTYSYLDSIIAAVRRRSRRRRRRKWVDQSVDIPSSHRQHLQSTVDEWVASVNECVASVQKEVSRSIR